jgi:hypothetical protein
MLSLTRVRSIGCSIEADFPYLFLQSFPFNSGRLKSVPHPSSSQERTIGRGDSHTHLRTQEELDVICFKLVPKAVCVIITTHELIVTKSGLPMHISSEVLILISIILLPNFSTWSAVRYPRVWEGVATSAAAAGGEEAARARSHDNPPWQHFLRKLGGDYQN